MTLMQQNIKKREKSAQHKLLEAIKLHSVLKPICFVLNNIIQTASLQT